jgi:hypothetical protein
MVTVLTTVDIGTSPLLAAAIGFGALGTVFVIAGVLALLGLHPARFALRTFLGLILLSVGALAGVVTAGLQGYRALTREEVAARLSVRPTGPQRFTVVVRVPGPGGRESSYSIVGDEITVDAHILKWKPLVNVLGLHTAYELGRVGGRYRDLGQERTGARTVYSLAEDRTVDLFDLRQQYALFGPLVDAEYGSATFVSVTRPAELEVRVSTTGLLLREVGH